MKDLFSAPFIIIATVALLATSTSGASAACTGGANVKGSFGVVINGPATGSEATELYAGIMTSDGKCSLTGSLTGGLTGSPITTPSLTGVYTFGANGVGIMTVMLSGATSPLTFTFALASGGKELLGIQTDGIAVATLDMLAISKSTYSDASINGFYVDTCYGANPPGTLPSTPANEVDYATYDGAGNISILGYLNSGYVTGGGISGNATYVVNTDGTYTTQRIYGGSRYPGSGAIVAGGTELFYETQIPLSSGGFTVQETCVAKKGKL